MSTTYNKPHECRGNPYAPPRSLEETLEIIAEARKRRNKPVSNRPTAQRLVLDNRTIVEDLRDRGHRQEDAVLLILELSNDAHKPDTIRKAIRAVVGEWGVAPVSPSNSEASRPRAEEGAQEPPAADHAERVDEEGGLML